MRKKYGLIHTNSQPGVFTTRKQALDTSSVRYPTVESQYQPDSLQRFQQQIQKSLLSRKISRQSANIEPTINRKKRTYTQLYDSEQQEPRRKNRENGEISRLQSELGSLKSEIQNYKKDRYQDRLDQLIQQMNRNKQAQLEMLRQRNSTPNNVFYPPFPPYPPPYYPQNDNRRGGQYDFPKSNKIPNCRAKRMLRKYFFVAAFPVFLKNEAKKLAQRRKVSLRTFYLQKFNSQMLHLKNWLVQGLSFSIPVILQKQKINLQFWLQKRQAIADKKKNLLLQLVKIGMSKIRQECTSQQIMPFAQILHCLCSRGSFAMSRFWSAYEMKSICISDFLGCIRADLNLQKMMLCLVVIVKVLIFNMLLQPHKFDHLNFPRDKQPLCNNMHIIASVYYRLASQLLQKYLDKPRLPFYKLGNWLKVKEEFIVECCEPLCFKVDMPEQKEWISGMLVNELQELDESEEWSDLRERMEEIVDLLYIEMCKRRKEVVRNQKYKLYS